VKKVLVSLPKDIITIMDTELKGKLGEGYSDILRTIILSWLADQGYLSKGGKVAKE
jgi:hypothetical protein